MALRANHMHRQDLKDVHKKRVCALWGSFDYENWLAQPLGKTTCLG